LAGARELFLSIDSSNNVITVEDDILDGFYGTDGVDYSYAGPGIVPVTSDSFMVFKEKDSAARLVFHTSYGWEVPGRAAGYLYKTDSSSTIRSENYVGLTLSSGVEEDIVLVQRTGPIAASGLTPGELVRFDENGDLTHDEQFYPNIDLTVGRALATDLLQLERVKETRVYQPVVEHFRVTGQLNTATSHVVTHNFGEKPQLVNLWYYDGSDEYYLNSPSYVGLATDTELTIDLSSLSFGGGEYVRYEIVAFPEVPTRFAVEGSLYRSAWLTSTAITEVSHNLGGVDAIRGGSIIEWDTTTGKGRVLPLNTLVEDFDNEKFYLNWGSVTPSATLKYRIVGSNAPMPQGLYTEVGGFTKFVGANPGHYANLETAVADAQPGDRILVRSSEPLTGTLEISADDVEVKIAPGVVLAQPILVTGNRVRVNGYSIEQGAGESWAYAVRIEGDEVYLDGKLEASATGTVTDIVNTQAGAEFSTVSMIYRSNGGTVTNEITDGGTYSDIVVRGA